jgi:pimeloyl-ACP methyl ester carboxylesterase
MNPATMNPATGSEPRIALALAPGEQHFRIPSHHPQMRLFLRYLAPSEPASRQADVVLYVHGATFPSALSIAHRFDGRSWRDELCDAGFHVWAFDFHGFGYSDPYPAMAEPAERSPALGRADDAARQIATVVRYIIERHAIERVHVIAHSWGTIATGLFATLEPELVNRLVFFAPIAQRHGNGSMPPLPAWRVISEQTQWDRFIEDVPPGATPVLSTIHFDEWAQLYLGTDAQSGTRVPPSVKVPSGPLADITAAWHGRLAYDPRGIEAPLEIVRGEWDNVVNDRDARWLFDALSCSPVRRDVKIGRATHLMHLESNRHALHRESITFLRGDQ